MGDVISSRPNRECLVWIASEQHGYFTNPQALACGYSRFLLARGTETGRFVRVRRGLYRLRDYPSFPREEVVAAWLAVGKDIAVVSHESALEFLDLSDVIPQYIHLTVPRSKRNLPRLPNVKVHTTGRPFGPLDVVTREGIRLTSAGRSILDAAETGTAPDQIEMAVHQALDRGLITRERLESDARFRSGRVQRLIDQVLDEIPS